MSKETPSNTDDDVNGLVEATQELSIGASKPPTGAESVNTNEDVKKFMKEKVQEGPATIKANFPASGNKFDESEDIYSVYLLIEDRYCGGLIGRSGKSIAAIRELTGATICLQDRRLKFDNHLPKRALKLYGPEQCLRKAVVATAHRLLEVKAANLAYKNNTEISSLPEFPTYEITILSPLGVVTDEFRNGGHVVIESFLDWELIDVWGIEKIDENDKTELPFSELCMKIVKDSGLGRTVIDEKRLSTAHVTRRNNSRGQVSNHRGDYRQNSRMQPAGAYGEFPLHRNPRRYQQSRNNYSMGNGNMSKSGYGQQNAMGKSNNMGYSNGASYAQMQNQSFSSYKVPSTNGYSINPSQNAMQAAFSAPFSNMHGDASQNGSTYPRQHAQDDNHAWPKPNTSRDLYQTLDTSRSQQYNNMYGQQADTRQQYGQQSMAQTLPDQTMNLYYLPRMNPDWEDI